MCVAEEGLWGLRLCAAHDLVPADASASMLNRSRSRSTKEDCDSENSTSLYSDAATLDDQNTRDSACYPYMDETTLKELDDLCAFSDSESSTADETMDVRKRRAQDEEVVNLRSWDVGSYVNGPDWCDAFHSGSANVTMAPHHGVDTATHLNVSLHFQRFPGSPLYSPDQGLRGRDSVKTDVAAPPSPIEPRTPEPEATTSFDRSATPQSAPSEVDYMPGVRSLHTVMLRNLPNNYSRSMLLELLDSEGFAGRYDFVYLPMDFKSRASLGYAFVNLVSACQATPFWKHFDGFSRWVLPSQKVCSVNWSSPYQGLEAHVERYRNSPVMHDAVPDDYKPMLFRNGVRIAFPPPTRKLRAPRSRPGRNCIA